MSRKIIQTMLLLLLVMLAMGCGKGQDKTRKLRDLKGTVLSEDQLPEELKAITEEKKADRFRLTFTDEDALYICIGYGKQPTGGYSIAVTELYETANAVYVHTNLMGPAAGEERKESPSYPYIVIKLEKQDKTVVFE